jgi:hypothetical protein
MLMNESYSTYNFSSPYCGELAVGVERGILIWSIPHSLKFGSAKSELITAEGHCPVTSVDYSHTVSCLFQL